MVIAGSPNNGRYYSRTLSISLGILMGIVWEAYHKGVPLLGVPENPTDFGWCFFPFETLTLDSLDTDTKKHIIPI